MLVLVGYDLVTTPPRGIRWLPVSLVYAERRWEPFEIFSKMISSDYLDKITAVFFCGSQVDILDMCNYAEKISREGGLGPILSWIKLDKLCNTEELRRVYG